MNYAKLRGKIREIFGTQLLFADAMKMNPSTLSGKLNKKYPWTCDEMVMACGLLGIPLDCAGDYFFCDRGLEIQTF